MTQNNEPGSSSSTKDASSLSCNKKKQADSTTQHSIHIFRDKLEFKIPAFYWRLKVCRENEAICRSQVMSVPTNPPTKWRFDFLRKPNQWNTERFFAVGFGLASPRAETCAGKLELFDKTEKRLHFVEFNGIFKTYTYVAYFSQSEHILLTSIGQDMVNNDLFILRCELEVLQTGSYISSQKTNSRRDDELFTIDWGELWKTIEIDDVVTLKLAESEYRAHKSVLSKRSPVFAAMFKSETKEKHTNEVVIEDLDEAVLKILLKYIYSNQISKADLNDETAISVLAAAEKYILPGLKDQCEDFLIGKLSLETCLEYLKLSDMFSCARLKSQILILLNSKLPHEITSPELWKKLLESNFAYWLTDVAAEMAVCNRESKNAVSAADGNVVPKTA